MMNPLLHQTRRHFFRDCGVGLGKIALASLAAERWTRSAGAADASSSPFAPQPPHFPAKAKRVIHLFMAGAPSQLDLFDHKPKLAELAGKPLPPSVIKGQRYAFIQPDAAVLGPQFRFARHGESGVELSQMLPHLAKVVDDVAFVKSVHTDLFNHAPAQLFVNTGSGIPGRPSMGSWLSYGIGSEANDLPSFVVLKSGGNLSGGTLGALLRLEVGHEVEHEFSLEANRNPSAVRLGFGHRLIRRTGVVGVVVRLLGRVILRVIGPAAHPVACLGCLGVDDPGGDHDKEREREDGNHGPVDEDGHDDGQ